MDITNPKLSSESQVPLTVLPDGCPSPFLSWALRVPTGVSGLLTGGRLTLSLIPGVGEPVLKSLLPPREEEEGFSLSSFTGAASSLLGTASGFNLDKRPGLSGDRKHR